MRWAGGLRDLQAFNSIKVQLSQAYKAKVDSLSNIFQFHKGTIKPCRTVHASCSYASFNSIKVQLSHELTPRTVLFTDNFQFHKGTIKPVGLINLVVL